MKIVSILLALCFSFNLVAGSASSLEFERALGEYVDTLSMDWDPRDLGFYRNATQDFYLKYEGLILDKGLTPQDVLEVVSVKLSEPKTAAMRKLKDALVQSVNSDEDFMGLIKDANTLFERGLSWKTMISELDQRFW